MSSNIRIQRICQLCGDMFTARTTVTKFCSHRCASRAHKNRIKDLAIESSNKETTQAIQLPMNELSAKEFLSMEETAKLIGLSIRTVMRLIQNGSLKASKIGRRTIIQKIELKKLFA